MAELLTIAGISTLVWITGEVIEHRWFRKPTSAPAPAPCQVPVVEPVPAEEEPVPVGDPRDSVVLSRRLVELEKRFRFHVNTRHSELETGIGRQDETIKQILHRIDQ